MTINPSLFARMTTAAPMDDLRVGRAFHAFEHLGRHALQTAQRASDLDRQADRLAMLSQVSGLAA